MAVLAERQQVQAMTPWGLYFACRHGHAIRNGTLIIWAPDPDTAIETVRQNPAWFGLTEHAIVGHATNLRIGHAPGVRL